MGCASGNHLGRWRGANKRRFFTIIATKVSRSGGIGNKQPTRLHCLPCWIPMPRACYRALTPRTPIWRQEIASLALPPHVYRWPSLRRLRPSPPRPLAAPLGVLRVRIPRSRPVERGIAVCSKKILPPFFKKVVHPLALPKRPSPPGRIPPLLVANGVIGLGRIGNRK